MVTINIEAGKPTPPLLYISIIGAHGHSIFKLELKINKENNYSAAAYSQPKDVALCGFLWAYGKAGNEMTETGNGNWKWKHNFFTAVVLARFNCCYPSALFLLC